MEEETPVITEFFFYAPPRQAWKDWKVENPDDYKDALDDVLLLEVR